MALPKYSSFSQNLGTKDTLGSRTAEGLPTLSLCPGGRDNTHSKLAISDSGKRQGYNPLLTLPEAFEEKSNEDLPFQ